jgi:flagellar biosynthesis protein FlhF
MYDMDVRTYRAATMQEALAMVRRELGPDAAVLHTREVRGGGIFRFLPGFKRIEVTASASVQVPSRFADERPQAASGNESVRRAHAPASAAGRSPAEHDEHLCGAVPRRASSGSHTSDVAGSNPDLAAADGHGTHRRRSDAPAARTDDGHHELGRQISQLQHMVADLCRRTGLRDRPEMPQELFQLYTDLIEAELSEDVARELAERVRTQVGAGEMHDPMLLRARLTRIVESDLRVAGPIRLTEGRAQVVALVGPTGVGKTTTIAKLAANFRLRERRRVGLITVDTYRIAAVEQLRTYADIIDLPMQVVSSPREMREAVARMADLDLVLMDTAGRSPRDEVKIHELKTFLAEAQASEVHLVLSSVSSAAALQRTAERFAVVGTTALILTKLDEATNLGNLLPLLRGSGLPLSYLTNGQNVPDDIEAPDAARLARLVLGLDDRLA